MKLKEQKLAEINKGFQEMINCLGEYCEDGKKLHEVEFHLFRHLLRLGKELLSYYIILVSQITLLQAPVKDSQGKRMKNAGKRNRSYRSIFGVLSINRTGYHSKTDKMYFRLDERLGLPSDKFSYLLKEWLAYGATELDFDQSAKVLESILGQKLNGMQSRRCLQAYAVGVKSYYEQVEWKNPLKDKTNYLCLGIDGKGIPIARRDRDGQYLSTAARLGKGRRKGIKKEATVCVSSSFTARCRDSDQIINNLFRKEQQPSARRQGSENRLHQAKHLRAFVADKVRGIEYGIDHLIKRDASGQKPIVILVDGEPVLRKRALQFIQEKGLSDRLAAIVLDFIHVLEKVWRVANAYKGEKDPGRQDWVEQQARLLLNSQTQEVLDQWKEIERTKTYSKSQSKHIRDAINYVEKRIPMMDYKTFLEKGFPITTGAVESACGHFVKGRMERNGMHWTKDGAQLMLDLRAVNKNGDWKDFIETFIEKEQQTLYKKAA